MTTTTTTTTSPISTTTTSTTTPTTTATTTLVQLNFDTSKGPITITRSIPAIVSLVPVTPVTPVSASSAVDYHPVIYAVVPSVCIVIVSAFVIIFLRRRLASYHGSSVCSTPSTEMYENTSNLLFNESIIRVNPVYGNTSISSFISESHSEDLYINNGILSGADKGDSFTGFAEHSEDLYINNGILSGADKGDSFAGFAGTSQFDLPVFATANPGLIVISNKGDKQTESVYDHAAPSLVRVRVNSEVNFPDPSFQNLYSSFDRSASVRTRASSIPMVNLITTSKFGDTNHPPTQNPAYCNVFSSSYNADDTYDHANIGKQNIYDHTGSFHANTAIGKQNIYEVEDMYDHTRSFRVNTQQHHDDVTEITYDL